MIGKGLLTLTLSEMWIATCDADVTGVRFNAEKRHVGMYHSTKIWSFVMRHHCGCKIEIHTDPRKTEYRIVEGIRRKVSLSGHSEKRM